MQAAEEYCYAPVNYMGPVGPQAVDVSIANGRSADSLDWHTNGFELLKHTSTVTDWNSDADIRAHYYKEMSDLALRLSGASHALINSHISRNPDQAEIHQDYAPIQFVHSDFADDYGERTAQLYAKGTVDSDAALAAAGITAADVASAKRLLILQFWRNVGDESPDLPIAFVDALSVRKADMHRIHVPSYAGGDFPFDTLSVRPPPSATPHGWYVFPRMRKDEVVVFRTFDSEMAAKGEPYWTPHAAFEDPLAGANAPPRRSIEVRATCLFM